MSIEKKSLISTLKTTKKANVASSVSGEGISKSQGVFPKTKGVFPKTKGVFPKTKGVFPKTKGVFPKTKGVFPKTKAVPQPKACSRKSKWEYSFGET